MRTINKALLIPTLLPLILLLFISFINNEKRVQIKLLLWESQEIKLGTFISISTIAGFLIGTFPAFILNSNYQIKRRKVIYNPYNSNNSDALEKDLNLYDHDDLEENDINHEDYIERDVREPSPTISVPYKVIRMSNQSEIRTESNKESSEVQNSFKDNLDLASEQEESLINKSQSSDWSNITDEKW